MPTSQVYFHGFRKVQLKLTARSLRVCCWKTVSEIFRIFLIEFFDTHWFPGVFNDADKTAFYQIIFFHVSLFQSNN